MSEQSKLDHDQPGNPRATHLDGKDSGITNKPKQESERQTKVVEGDSNEGELHPAK